MRLADREMPGDSFVYSEQAQSSELSNAMTVDVEDYFQVSAFEPHVRREEWASYPCNVEKNTDRILALFENCGVKATFFVLGWVAEQYPALVRRIVSGGHELASHGFDHTRVTCQTPQQFTEDVLKTKRILEDIGGVPVLGYRAASYSINENNLWALRILEDTGHSYSSSVYPIKHDLYGMPSAPRFRFMPNEADGILEIPITTIHMFKRNIPCGGGGYFRLFPYWCSRWALRKVNKEERQPCIFYFHPWEIDPGQPRVEGLSFKTRFRHYLNLGRMESRLTYLLKDFRWDRMDRIFLQDSEKRMKQ